MRLVVAAGATEAARIDGISAAGADPSLLAHTPSADLELLAYGRPLRAPVVPVSPSGCPTPAVVTRAAREVLGFDVLGVDAGLAKPTAAPTVALGAEPGGDLRTADPVPAAAAVYESARELGAGLPDDRLLVGETIPGGTTTALGVLTALGERDAVSSSLPTNPLELKREVVADGLDASGLSAGDLADRPVAAVREMGDPVLAAVAGLVAGAVESGTEVVLAGGTQLAAAAALVRHDGVAAPLTLATTAYVAADESAGIEALAAELDLDLVVSDPGFGAVDHPAADAYEAGEAKEGVGMGGALALAEGAFSGGDSQVAAVRDRALDLTDDLLAEADAA